MPKREPLKKNHMTFFRKHIMIRDGLAKSIIRERNYPKSSNEDWSWPKNYEQYIAKLNSYCDPWFSTQKLP